MNRAKGLSRPLTTAALALFFAVCASGASAQGLLNKLKERAKPKVETNSQAGAGVAGVEGNGGATGIGPGTGNVPNNVGGGVRGGSAVWPGNANVSAMSVDKTSVQVQTWLHGPVRDGSVAAYLFYKGQQVGHTEDTMHGVARRDVAHETFNANTPYEWGRYVFTFFDVQVFNRETNGAHAEGFRLERNPGEYEVKVLRGGKLARTFKFTVGADGRVADNGVARASRLDTYRVVVPAQVLGAEDGQWDGEAWKAGAFYGNPLSGFTPGN